MSLQLISEVTVTPGKIMNGRKAVFETIGSHFLAFAKAAYENLNPKYPKFFKMDPVSKLCFLACEQLMKSKPIDWDGDRTAIFLGTRSGSLHTDLKHAESICDTDHFFPSPAVFVYTLPNIMLGEACIRHKITGENSCFIIAQPDFTFLTAIAQNRFLEGEYTYFILGWVNFDPLNYFAHLKLYRGLSEK